MNEKEELNKITVSTAIFELTHLQMFIMIFSLLAAMNTINSTLTTLILGLIIIALDTFIICRSWINYESY